MLVESIVLSIIIGKLRGFRIYNLEKATIEKWWLIVMSVSIELISSMILKNNFEPYSSIINDNYFIIHLLVYILLFTFIISNLYHKGFYLVLLGSLLNFIVIMANKGFMPVSTEIATSLGFTKGVQLLKAGKIAGHTALVKGETSLWLLGDIINIPPPYPFPQNISIGDILISIGIFIFIQFQMKE